MPQFNLNEYETVAERLKRFYKDYPDGRIITENLTEQHDRVLATWVVKASIFLNADDQRNNLAKATGLAFEVDGVGMAQKTSALETCETSAIGRALGNMGYFGSLKPTREEMSKVRGNIVVTPAKNFVAALDNINDLEGLRALYLEAKQAKQPATVLDAIKSKADGLNGATS
jgi:hypothetical protein